MGVNVIYVRDFREACELSLSPRPLYIEDDGDLFRLHGLRLNDDSPPIYVSRRVSAARFMEAALPCYQPTNGKEKNQ